MPATKHCAAGICRSDSRYASKDYMHGVPFFKFPNPKKEPKKCLKWVLACKRERFSIQNVTRATGICSKHFVDGKPSAINPDPIPANKDAAKVV